MSDTNTDRSKDVAASLQSITEKELLKIYNDTYKTYPNENLCLAGGVASLIVLQIQGLRVILKICTFHHFLMIQDWLLEWVYIIGIKLKITQKKIKVFSPYLGPKYSKNDFLNAINKDNSFIKRLYFLNKSLDICNLKLKDIDVIITNKQDYGRKPPWDVPSTDKSDCVSLNK